MIPKVNRHFTGLAYDGKRVVVAGNEEVLIINARSNAIARWRLTETGIAKGKWQAYIVAGGQELWLHKEGFNHQAPIIHRYRLP